jgi:hypothetical protein
MALRQSPTLLITNQFVSDKTRSSQEDKLTSLKNIPIHILDRSWIIDKIYNYL